MKNNIGFNIVFALIAFPIGIALISDTDFSTFTFKKPALDAVYLITFVVAIFLMLKKNKREQGNNKQP
ncbi:hypothetical protein [Parasegetibacter sp. NRK P23]|uniref:hypothetical protein n=1 Tax=Parasegetibacter sp. NRK P23 TaxID=2942999 RepID=UPI00204328D3|nr:hypothetical protein [Parasegetibacter sp. NRK P23]MCM5528394.1 hypothetical protein [Parasegetibacter sp. NRK P23]